MLFTNYEISEKRELKRSINLKNSKEKSKLHLTQILRRIRKNENTLKKSKSVALHSSYQHTIKILIKWNLSNDLEERVLPK